MSNVENVRQHLFRRATKLLWPGGFLGVLVGNVFVLAVTGSLRFSAINLLQTLALMYTVSLVVLMISDHKEASR